MKKIIIAIALIFALPIIANAEESKTDAPVAKEHHMKNTNPAAQADESAPMSTEHNMRNSDPTPASKTEPAKKAPGHSMKNN